jgi:hypothetical protein
VELDDVFGAKRLSLHLGIDEVLWDQDASGEAAADGFLCLDRPRRRAAEVADSTATPHLRSIEANSLGARFGRGGR